MFRRLTSSVLPGVRCVAAPAAIAFAGLTLLLTPAPSWAQQKITPELLIGSAVTGADSPRYADVAEAIRRFTNRDLPGAQLLLEKARRKHPKLPPVSVMLAKMHLLSGNSAAVRPALEQSVTEDADDPEPYLLLAEDALNGNRSIEADALFDKAVTLIDSYDANPKRKRSFIIRAYKGRAVVDQRRRKWEQAETDLRAWLEEDPENATAHNQLGSVLFMLERPQDGFKAFEEAKRLDDKLPNPNVTAGTVLQRRGESSQALEYFRRAYKEDGNEVNSTQYANALIITGDLKEANKVVLDALRDAPRNFNLRLLSGVIARIQGDSRKAEQGFLQALALRPTHRDTILQLTYVLSARDDEDAATRASQYALMNARLNEKNADAQVALAWVLERTKRTREAQAALGNALKLGTPSPDGQVLVAKMLLARDQRDSAKRILTNALAKPQGIFVTQSEAEELLATLN